VTWNFNFSTSGALGGSVGVSDLQKNYQADPEERRVGGGGEGGIYV